MRWTWTFSCRIWCYLQTGPLSCVNLSRWLLPCQSWTTRAWGRRLTSSWNSKNCRSVTGVSISPARQTVMKCKISVSACFSCRTSSCQSLTETTVSWPPSWPTSFARKAWWTIRTSITWGGNSHVTFMPCCVTLWHHQVTSVMIISNLNVISNTADNNQKRVLIHDSAFMEFF